MIIEANIGPCPGVRHDRRELFDQIGLDGGALTLLGDVVRQLDRPASIGCQYNDPRRGRRRGARGDRDDDADRSHRPRRSRRQHRYKGGTDWVLSRDATRHRMRPGGYLLFHVGSGPDAYAAVLGLLGDSGPEVVFDGVSLQRGDRFVATVIRPVATSSSILRTVRTACWSRLSPARGG